MYGIGTIGLIITVSGIQDGLFSTRNEILTMNFHVLYHMLSIFILTKFVLLVLIEHI